MAKIFIIVEGELDKPFIDSVLIKMGLKISFKNNDNEQFETDDRFEIKKSPADPNKNKPTTLIKALQQVANRQFFADKNPVKKVVIIRDLDENPLSDTLELVNNAIKGAYAASVSDIPEITKEQEFVTLKFKQNSNDTDDDATEIQFACYIIGVYVDNNGVEEKQGETDDILKKMIINSPNVADYINNHLPNCLNSRNPTAILSDKKLTKLWLYNYQRFDDPAYKVANYRFDAQEMMSRGIFDFDKNIRELNELKDFLNKCI